jgi:hypothetical protein
VGNPGSQTHRHMGIGCDMRADEVRPALPEGIAHAAAAAAAVPLTGFWDRGLRAAARPAEPGLPWTAGALAPAVSLAGERRGWGTSTFSGR